MGLDNGVIVKGIKKNEIPNYIMNNLYHYEHDADDEFEFAYWRKEWGFRNEVTAKLKMPSNDGNKKLDIEDLNAIIRILKKYLKESYYIENADSIWEYDEAIDCNIKKYISLSWLYEYWQCHPDNTFEARFYDSY